MRKIFVVIFLLLGTSAEMHAQVSEQYMMGGVDVGNGGRVVAGMLEGFFRSEKELEIQINQTFQEVNLGQHPRVQQWILQGQCRSSMKYNETDVIPGYREVDGQWVKGVSGYTKIILEKCRDPYAIDADENPIDLPETGSLGF